MAIQLTEKNFGQEVLESDLPVLVDFYADWCGPCILMAPILEELSEEFKGKIQVGKLNLEECPSLAERYHVLNIPTFLFFKGGELKETLVGGMTKEDLRAKMDSFV